MDLQDQIDIFNLNFKKIQDEKTELNKKLSSLFKERLQKLEPVLSLMHQNQLYFVHPETKYKTLHGVILGLSNGYDPDLYVYRNGNMVRVVKTANDEIDRKIDLENFISICDYEFAMKGIVCIENYLSKLIHSESESNQKLASFINQYLVL